jgi:orotidine-5'-phosphate decarboxylase
MTYKDIVNQIKLKKSFLCVGLDSDIAKIPEFFKKYDNPVFEFNKQIIDATQKYAIAYKPNLAFYEALGIKGWEALEKTTQYIKNNFPEIFLIADAKRGDIGNTSQLYAKAFFETLPFDAITVAPYMGSDSVSPFLSYKNKWVIILALTSNQGASDFQFIEDKSSGLKIYQTILKTAFNWGHKENIMFVIGATKADMLKEVRQIVPDHFLLVPGIGAQGGKLEEVVNFGINSKCGLIVNASRSIIFASKNKDFAEQAATEAHKLQNEMNNLLKINKII